MTEKQYKRSCIWQLIALLIGIVILLSTFFMDIKLGHILYLLAVSVINIKEEIRQRFYEMKRDNDIINEIGKD